MAATGHKRHGTTPPLSLGRPLRRVAKRGFLLLYEAGLRVGIVVLPNHYYASVPDLRSLRRSRPTWTRKSEMRGVTLDPDAEARDLRRLVAPFEPEFRGNPAYREAIAGSCGPGFGYIEAQALHGFIRATAPRRVIEIGSGVSTYCMLQAGQRNAAENHPLAIACVEPYPSPWLRKAPVRLIAERVEDVDLALFDELQAGDLLFVDSTHTVRVGGDVVRVVLEVLPRLRPGVFVHFHDIYFPYDFQRDADRTLFQWMETALLHAFLIDNDRAEILFCLSHLHHERPQALRQVFPEYNPEPDINGLRDGPSLPDRHFPSSLYFRLRGPRG